MSTHRRQAAAERLCTGTSALARRFHRGLEEWVRAGERPGDAPLRLAYLAVVALVAWLIVRAAPWLMWVAVPTWCARAWHAAPAPTADPAPDAEPEPADDEPDEAPDTDQDDDAGPGPEEFTELLREALGDASGVHLAQLAERLTGNPKDTPRVRALCTATGVPVHPSVRVPGRGVSTGIRAHDLHPAPPTPPQSTPVAVVVPGQRTTTGPTTTTATRIEDLGGGAAVVIHTAGEHRHHTV